MSNCTPHTGNKGGSHRTESLIERDPEVIPDVDIAAKVGKDLFLDEKISRHESGQGYVRVVEHLVLWKENLQSSHIPTNQGHARKSTGAGQ